MKTEPTGNVNERCRRGKLDNVTDLLIVVAVQCAVSRPYSALPVWHNMLFAQAPPFFEGFDLSSFFFEFI
jgi:hypothetical protein